MRCTCLSKQPFSLLSLVQACVLLCAVAGCRENSEPKAAAPAEVGIVTLVTQPVTISNTLTGRAVATTASDVRPQVDGIIKARLFTEGAIVQAGQTLYQIDSRAYDAALNMAHAQLESAQATLVAAQAQAERYRALVSRQVISRQAFDDAVAAAGQARAQVHQYQAAVETARLNLEYTRVLAPISGKIGRSAVTPGSLVTALQTTPLASIQQLDPIYIDITQSDSELLTLRQSLASGSVLPTSAPARLKFEDGSDYPFAGTVEFSEVTVNQQAGTVTLRIRFPNPQGLLMPGMFVRVDVPQGQIPEGVLAPQQGISRDASGHATALLVDASGKVVRRAVNTGQVINNQWLITAGLTRGDRLIVEGLDRAQVGATVNAVAVKLESNQ